MTTEKLHELHEKTLRVINIKGYLEDYNESIGISKADLEKNLALVEVDLDIFLSKLTPSREAYDSFVFTTDGSNNPVMGGYSQGIEYYLSVPHYEDERNVNLRVSVEEI